MVGLNPTRCARKTFLSVLSASVVQFSFGTLAAWRLGG
jgi:hypothetical protein